MEFPVANDTDHAFCYPIPADPARGIPARTGKQAVILEEYRAWLTNALTAAGYDTSLYRGLSTRRGGLDSAVKAKLPLELQQTMGRWQSWVV